MMNSYANSNDRNNKRNTELVSLLNTNDSMASSKTGGLATSPHQAWKSDPFFHQDAAFHSNLATDRGIGSNGDDDSLSDEDAPLLATSNPGSAGLGATKNKQSVISSIMFTKPFPLELPSPDDVEAAVSRLSWASINNFDQGQTKLELKIQDLEMQEQRRCRACCQPSSSSNHGSIRKLPKFSLVSLAVAAIVLVCMAATSATILVSPRGSNSNGTGAAAVPSLSVGSDIHQGSDHDHSAGTFLSSNKNMNTNAHDSFDSTIDAKEAALAQEEEAPTHDYDPQDEQEEADLIEYEQAEKDSSHAQGAPHNDLDQDSQYGEHSTKMKMRIPSILNSLVTAESP